MELHARHSLEGRGDEVDGDRPLLVAELGVGHGGPGASAEALPAVAAAVGHLVCGARLDVHRPAVRQPTPCGQRDSQNHRSAAASSGNIANSSARLIPLRLLLPGAVMSASCGYHCILTGVVGQQVYNPPRIDDAERRCRIAGSRVLRIVTSLIDPPPPRTRPLPPPGPVSPSRSSSSGGYAGLGVDAQHRPHATHEFARHGYGCHR